jgi:ribose/xylose/arabinose/galactoside ABC-type transport system permease subunit
VPSSFESLAWGSDWKATVPILLYGAVAAVSLIYLRRTTIGRSVCIALTGILLASRMGMGNPLVGDRSMLDSISPVLIGGKSKGPTSS